MNRRDSWTFIFDKSLVYYLASPYTAIGLSNSNKALKEHERFKTITNIAVDLISRYGITLITPITMSHTFKHAKPNKFGTDWEFWKQFDLNLINKSDALIVAQMEGWKESVGVTAEIEYGKELNKSIYFLNIDNYKITVL